MNSQGQVVVHCVSARNLYSADILKKQDPYLQLTLGTTTLTTTTHKRGGTSPHWGQSLTFPIDPTNPVQFLHVQCYDKDTLTADDQIGEAAISLPSALGATGAFDGWIQLHRGKRNLKPAGEVQLHIRYEAIPSSFLRERAPSYSSTNSRFQSLLTSSSGDNNEHGGGPHAPIPIAVEPSSSRRNGCKVSSAVAGAVALAGAGAAMAMDKWDHHQAKKMEKKQQKMVAKQQKKHTWAGGFMSGFKEECANNAGASASEAMGPEGEEVAAAVTEGVVGGIVESILGGLFEV